MTDYIQLALNNVQEQYPFIVYPKVPPNPRTLEPGTILGSWAYSLPGKYRIVLNAQRELASGVMPADVTRAWIRDEYQLPLRRRKNQLNRTYQLPIHAVRGEPGDCCYVDIKGAYLRILQFGYDVEYLFNKYIAASPRPVPQQIAANKFCYSIAVAMSTTKISSLAIVSKDAEIFNVNKFNLYSNPCLYSLASDVLNAIAAEALSVMGAHIHYVNTDGFIVTEKYAQSLINIIASWGFEARIKHSGNTRIGGVASWKIGGSETKRFDAGGRDFTCAMMEKDDRRWLKTNFTRFLHLLDNPLTK